MKNLIIADTLGTIISYNIKYDNKSDVTNNWNLRKKKLVKILKTNSPSFIGIQEGLLHQVEYIDTNLPNYNYIGVGRDDGEKKGEFCAIYYESKKYKLLKQSTFWLSKTPEKVSIGWDAALERVCTYGYFEDRVSNARLWVFNTHFDHIGQQSRLESSRLILEKIKKLNSFNEPTILMGDFNALPKSDAIQLITKKLNDAMVLSRQKHEGPIGTFNGFDTKENIDKRIDYVFTKKLDISSHKHLDIRLQSGYHVSDHLPVLIKGVLSP